jgi:hypothetical protein
MNRLAVFLTLASVLAVDVHAAAVVVLPLGGHHVGTTPAALTEKLRDELRSLDVDVLGGRETDQVIKSASALGGACVVTTTPCALQLGGLAGASTVLVGAIDSGQLVLRTLDVASEREVGRVVLPVDEPTALQGLRLAAIRLLRPDREVGYLALFVDVQDAVVSIDGRVVGRTPLDLQSLRPGPHQVVVSHHEFETQIFTVQALTGETVRLDVELASGATPKVLGRRRLANDDFRQVVVLDVDPPAPRRVRENRLLAALTTLVLVDELQRRRGVIVVRPADVARAPGGDAVAGCDDDECLSRVLGSSFADDVVVMGLAGDPTGVTLSARRLSLKSGEVTGPVSRRLEKSSSGKRQHITHLVKSVVDTLFPDDEVRSEVKPDATLHDRFAPPPVPPMAFAGTIGATAAAAVVTGLTTIGWVGATTESDPLSALWGVGAVFAGVATAAGLSAAIIEAPNVDWRGLAAENDALLDEVDARSPGMTGDAAEALSDLHSSR